MPLVNSSIAEEWAHYVPVPIEHVEVLPLKSGEAHLHGESYIRLSPRQWQLWQMIDGRASVAELSALLGFDNPGGRRAVAQFVQSMDTLGFVQNGQAITLEKEVVVQPGPVRKFLGLLPRILHPRLSFPIPAGLLQMLYQRVFRHLYHRVLLIPIAVLVVGSVLAYLQHSSVFDLQFLQIFEGTLMLGTLPIPKLALTYVMIFVIASVHELGHAMTATCYGRPIREAGVALVALIFLASFVRMKATWLLPARKRIKVLLSGGLFSGTLGALLIWLGVGLGGSSTGGYLRDLGLFTLWVTLVNFYPFLFRSDGYFLLEDMVGIPGLRRKAWQAALSWLPGREKKGSSGQCMRWQLPVFVALQLISYAVLLLYARRFI